MNRNHALKFCQEHYGMKEPSQEQMFEALVAMGQLYTAQLRNEGVPSPIETCIEGLKENLEMDWEYESKDITVWLSKEATGRPNDQKFKVLKLMENRSVMVVESCGDGQILECSTGAVCGVQLSDNYALLFEHSTARLRHTR